MWKFILILGLFLRPIVADSSSSSSDSDSNSKDSSEGYGKKKLSFCDQMIYAEEGAVAHHPNTLPYKFKISSYEYEPGAIISVTIYGDSFKGFYVRAFDNDTNQCIGSWEQSSELYGPNECKAALPADREARDAIKLKWKAPRRGRGKLFFKATIVKDRCCYWTNIVLKE